MSVKPINDLIHVRVDPPSEKVESGLLFKPETAYEHALTTGEVLAVGPGCWSKKGLTRIPVGIERGEGVVITAFHSKTQTQQSLQFTLGPDELLLHPKDILLVYDRKNPPGFFK